MVGIDHSHEYICDHAAHEEVTDICVHRRNIRFATHQRIIVTAPEDDVGRKEASGLFELLHVAMSAALQQNISAFALDHMHLFNVHGTTSRSDSRVAIR